MYKKCPKCDIEHINRGRFCSRKCANSRSFSEESRKKKSIQNKKYYEASSKEEKDNIKARLDNIRQKDGINHNKAASIQYLLKTDTVNLKWQSIRKKVIIEQDYKCLRCGISDWQEQKLTLQVDHIDGNKYNNERSNLRALCPNCHSQTPTFCGKKRK